MEQGEFKVNFQNYRDFYALKKKKKYVGDITYIVTGEDWLVIDLYSWSMNTSKVTLVYRKSKA